MSTISPHRLTDEHYGQTLVWAERGRKRRGRLVDVEHKDSHTVATVDTATTGRRPIILPAFSPITLEP